MKYSLLAIATYAVQLEKEATILKDSMFREGKCPAMNQMADLDLSKLAGDWYTQRSFNLINENYTCAHSVLKFEKDNLNVGCEISIDGHLIRVLGKSLVVMNNMVVESAFGGKLQLTG